MRIYFVYSLLPILLLFGACSANANQSGSNLPKAEIEKIIDDYIVNNPDVIERAIVALNEKQQAEEAAAARGRILAHSSKLYSTDNAFVLGDPNAPVTLVEFFDYQCGYCKRSAKEISGLIDEFDGKLNVIFKELPILSPQSLEASKAAIAADKQGKYIDMHLALMTHKGKLDKKTINAIAFNVGLDLDQLDQDIKSAETKEVLDATKKLAQNVGANGTPAFFIGSTNIAGADIAAVRAEIQKQIDKL